MKKLDIASSSKQMPLSFYRIARAVVGLELGSTDASLLNYFDFFSGIIPVEAASFIHVLPPLAPVDALFEKEAQAVLGGYTIHHEFREQMVKRVEKALPQIGQMTAQYHITEGDPLEELLSLEQEIEADLVMIGQRSENTYHGILAKNLVRKVKANALIVPEQAKPGLRSMLVPIDFSPNSLRALNHAVAINRQLEQKVKITCLNVYEVPSVNIYRVNKNWSQYVQLIEGHIQEAFQSFISSYPIEDAALIETQLIQKDLPGTGKYIMNYAEQQEVDLIVLGAKGHSRVHLLLMGSVAEKIISLNKAIPTLVIK